MVVLRRDSGGVALVWCDPEIADLVDALNNGELATVASCSGHGRRPGRISLADGRELFIAPDFSQAQAIGQALPFPDINSACRLPDHPVPESLVARLAAALRVAEDAAEEAGPSAWSARFEWMARAVVTEMRAAQVDGRRMAETGTGSGRSPTSAVGKADAPKDSRHDH